MKFKDLKLNIKSSEVSHAVMVSSHGLTSLEGCPKIIHNNFVCSFNDLESLVGGPEHVDEQYFCNDNQLASLDGIASYIGGDLSIRYNPIESIAGIHKKITYLGGRAIYLPQSCKKGLLDIFKMNAPNLNYIYCGNFNVNDIFGKYLKLVQSEQLTKSQAMLHCQSELIDKNLDEYTGY